MYILNATYKKTKFSRLLFLVLFFIGVPKSDLLHTGSLRGHRDCFEKYHLIANQDCPRSKLSKSTYYEEVKTILSKKINWIVQYAQNKDVDSDSECSKNPQHHLFNFRHKPDKKLLPQFDSQVPKYSAKWIDGSTGSLTHCKQRILEQKENTDFGLAVLQDSGATLCHKSVLWPHSHNQAQKKEETISTPEANVEAQHPHYSREECKWNGTKVKLGFCWVILHFYVCHVSRILL